MIIILLTDIFVQRYIAVNSFSATLSVLLVVNIWNT